MQIKHEKELQNTPPTRFGTPTKIAVVIALFLLTACFLFSALASIIAVNADYYRGGSPDPQINLELWTLLTNLTDRDLCELGMLKQQQEQNETYYSEYSKHRYDQLTSRYDPAVSNVLYRITAPDGTILADNFKGDPPTYLCHYNREEYLYNESKGNDKGMKETLAFTIDSYIRSDLSARDNAYYLKEIYLTIYSVRYLSPITAVITFFLCAALLAFLCAVAGRRKGESAPHANLFDKIPLEIVAGAYVLLLAALFVFTEDVLYFTPYFYSYAFSAILMIGVYTALFFSTLYVILTLATRIKTKILLRQTLIFIILAFFCKTCKRVADFLMRAAGNKRIFLKYVAYLLASIVCDLFILAFYTFASSMYSFLGFLLWCAKTAVLAFFLFCDAISKRVLSEGSRRMVEGDLESKISYAKLGDDYKELAVNFNHISDGLSCALEKQIKSERMKTELITNVSHDIKTPLTCIINYVDLLKSEPQATEKATEYLEILDKQSARLKKLTEDLIETSKAASGSISVNAQQTDVGILLSQAVGEYRDRFSDCGIEPVTDLPNQALSAFCDARLCWRIFDNLFSNVAKYSLSGTRIYLSASKEADHIRITLKNISKDPLNISPEELTERFVRGDCSRNTEGSGLGLSIAKSLAELQKGSLDISIDGDMFKVTLTLPKA